jgi:hypothetical protein
MAWNWLGHPHSVEEAVIADGVSQSERLAVLQRMRRKGATVEFGPLEWLAPHWGRAPSALELIRIPLSADGQTRHQISIFDRIGGQPPRGRWSTSSPRSAGSADCKASRGAAFSRRPGQAAMHRTSRPFLPVPFFLAFPSSPGREQAYAGAALVSSGVAGLVPPPTLITVHALTRYRPPPRRRPWLREQV